MSRNRFRDFLPVTLLFIILNGLLVGGRSMLSRLGADQDVLIIGNLLLFLITLLSFFLAVRALKNPNPHAFIRAVYGSIMIKLFVCMIAAFIYISIYRKNLNKPGLFTCMGLYLVYTFMEVSLLMKMMKKKTNA
jgi:hypothetical protein